MHLKSKNLLFSFGSLISLFPPFLLQKDFDIFHTITILTSFTHLKIFTIMTLRYWRYLNFPVPQKATVNLDILTFYFENKEVIEKLSLNNRVADIHLLMFLLLFKDFFKTCILLMTKKQIDKSILLTNSTYMYLSISICVFPISVHN